MITFSDPNISGCPKIDREKITECLKEWKLNYTESTEVGFFSVFIYSDILLVTLGVAVGIGGMFEILPHPILPPLDVFNVVMLGLP